MRFDASDALLIVGALIIIAGVVTAFMMGLARVYVPAAIMISGALVIFYALLVGKAPTR